MYDITHKHVVYKGEALLVNWGDTSTRGRTVTLELPLGPDAPETHPFRDLAVRSGKQAGQRLAIMVVQINDDETPVIQEHKLSVQAALLCKDPDFRKFMQGRSIATLDTEEDMKQWMYHGAGIKSRAAFDHDTKAANWFITQCKMPYEAHRKMIDSNIL